MTSPWKCTGQLQKPAISVMIVKVVLVQRKRLSTNIKSADFYTHPQSLADFHKVIISTTWMSRRMLPLIYLQYYFDSNEHEIRWNEDQKKSKTTFSTQKEIEEYKNLKAKKHFIKF